ncbi:CRISPR-associated helicase Cas3' [Gordonia sihwensis]|uniref:CRISPR-associated helicase Cas3' n=1 Tax=Gordonia sihwensis TaxID=173559 RepID=UPI002415C7AA|nr:CRISPR-associated helicase Cas3' [Gordonia sihwensis]WFN93911.1 CRISPR-associated helicase Cas3' [Gordonia sihwensis]
MPSKALGSDISAAVVGLSDAARSLWAKSDYTEGVEWLPLYQHMADAAAVAGILWDEFLPNAVKREVAAALGDDADLARRMLVWLAASHDSGKASPAFCVQVEHLRGKAEDAGLPFHPSVCRNRSALPHSMAGYLILRDRLTRTHGLGKREAAALAAISLGHHGTYATPPPHYDGGSVELLGTGTQWETVQRELVAFTETLAGLTTEDFTELGSRLIPQTAAVVATGLTIMADWIASNSDSFPLRTSPRPAHAATDAMRALRLPPPWSADLPDDNELFAAHLELSAPRPLQTRLVDLTRSIERPELIIIEAPTGDGKTKAALGGSEILAARFGLGGVLFALPTQATSDGIFGTVREWLDLIQGDDDVSLGLAHGKAQFNSDFQAVPRMSSVFDDSRDGRAVAHWFLTGRNKLATMSDFVVGTIDQLLLGALCAKHVVLRHLGVAGKVVVLDEVHAADHFMRQYLCRMLTWLAAYGVPVIAMSATLPPSIRHELVSAYNDGLGRQTPKPANDATYPRLTCTSDSGSTVIAVPSSGRSSRLTIDELPGDTDEIADAVLTAAMGGGNIAVVCDTVRRAQDLYRLLTDIVPPEVEIDLLHSRFLTPDRMRKEQRLRERLGPDAERRDGPLIVIATQVIEQSLDIDFDAMFSDIAPIDLLIQRAGRLHRHGHKDASRPSAHQTPRLRITGIARRDDAAPELDAGCRAVYGKSALFRCIATLDEHFARHDVIVSPDHVSGLVSHAYESVTAPPGWETEWEDAEASADEVRAKKAQRARSFLIPAPAKRPLVGWADQAALASDPTGERSVAQVRDSEDTIEVVVIQRMAGRRIIPEWATEMAGEDVDFATVIEDDIARAAAMNTLRLPGFLGSAGIGDALIAELEDNCIDTWQNSRWLRGVLPLVLDRDGNAEHVDHHFHYDDDLGLVVTPLEKL